MSKCPAKLSLSSEILPSLRPLRFPLAAQWLSPEFFFLGSLWPLDTGAAAIPGAEESALVDFFV